jgi:hypothetical protein
MTRRHRVRDAMRSSLSIRIKIRKFISMAKRHKVREAITVYQDQDQEGLFNGQPGTCQ